MVPIKTSNTFKASTEHDVASSTTISADKNQLRNQ
jgi:hypothetical protein